MSSSKHTKSNKQKIVSKHQIHKTDTGSPEVQIATLTEEIKKLTQHLKINRKDFSSRRGLLRKVSRRKKLLNYLLGEDKTRYLRTCKKNGIRTSNSVDMVSSTATSPTEIKKDGAKETKKESQAA